LKTLYYIQFTYTITGLGNKLITYINPAPEVILYLVSQLVVDNRLGNKLITYINPAPEVILYLVSQLVVDNPLVKSYYCTKALVATL